jgi:hypothetical protein
VTSALRELAARFLAATAFRPGRVCRPIATRANGQPAFGAYGRDPRTGILPANGLLVLTLVGRRISAMTRFDNSVLPSSDFPEPARLSPAS